MQEDRTLNELIGLLQTATISAEELIQDWEGALLRCFVNSGFRVLK